MGVHASSAPDPSEPLLGQAVSPAGRWIGVTAGAVIAIAAVAVHEVLLSPFAIVVALGALVARSSTLSVEGGMLIQRFGAAPLRGGSERVIPPTQIRGVEVVEEYDSDAAPGRSHQYWAALRLQDRRRRLAIGERHFDRASAEADAARVRAALAAHRPHHDRGAAG